MNNISVRGAITVERNTVADISAATVELYNEILKRNNLLEEDIVDIIFSMTKDLNAIYPVKALREECNVVLTPLFCTQEADIHNSLEKCIRILVRVNSTLTKKEVKHVYLKGAEKLRPDLKD